MILVAIQEEKREKINIKIYKEDQEYLREHGSKGQSWADIVHYELVELEVYRAMFDEKTRKIVNLEAKERMDRWRKRLGDDS